jgi:hypothetical protein
LQPTARRSTFWLVFLPVFPFGHFTGLALPRPLNRGSPDLLFSG